MHAKLNFYKKIHLELNKIYKLVRTDLWGVETSRYPLPIRCSLFICRFICLLFLDFANKKTLMVAAALSYATVLGIIPILMILIAVSKGFLEETLKAYTPDIANFIMLKFMPVYGDLQNSHGVDVYNSIQNYINFKLIPTITNINIQQLGIYGAIVLIVISLALLRTIEKAFNDIWGVTIKRQIWKLILNYWLIIALFPAVVLVILWLTGLSIYRDFIMIQNAGFLSRIFTDQTKTFIAIFIVFTIIYKFIPYTHVKFKSAVIGGLVGGILFQIVNMFSFIFVSNAIRTHYLYGSLGIVPIFLVALFIDWLILLFGAHVAFAVQNLEFFRTNHLSNELEPSDKQDIAVVCIGIIADCFIKMRRAPSADEISSAAGIPTAFFTDILGVFEKCGYIMSSTEEPPRFVLCVPPESIKLKDVMEKAIGYKNGRRIPMSSNKTTFNETIKICDLYRNSFSDAFNLSLADVSKKINV